MLKAHCYSSKKALTEFGIMNLRICMRYKKGDIVVVRLDFIMTIPEELISRKIGELP